MKKKKEMKKVSKEAKKIAKQEIKATVIIELNKIVTKFSHSKKADGVITKAASKLAKIFSKEIKPIVIEEKHKEKLS
jgi:FAD synthase